MTNIRQILKFMCNFGDLRADNYVVSREKRVFREISVVNGQIIKNCH